MNTVIDNHRHFAECDSTNDLAREWALDPDAPAPCGALVTADFQTQGRGRRGRNWLGGSGQSALMSFVYRPSVPPAEFGQLGLMSALAVAEALADLTDLDPRIKWPNDVLIDGGKVAGILIESCYSPAPRGLPPSRPVVIVGIGVNVGQERFEDVEGFIYPPTSLRLATGREWGTASVIRAVAVALPVWEECWRKNGFAPVLEGCRARLAVGAAVRRGEEQGQLWGLEADGGAVVRRADGTFAHWTTVD